MTNHGPANRSVSVHGIDGCRSGWICASRGLSTTGRSTGLGFHDLGFQLYRTFRECLAATGDDILVIDIPIGLPDEAVSGGRPCDRHAREILGRPRGSSVFTPPTRAALQAQEYQEACRLNGRGMSQQAFRIMPKIREVDAVLQPGDQTRVFEGHPELAFMRLAGEPIRESKHSAAGQQRRLELLETEFETDLALSGIRAELGPKHLAIDDLIDATVLTVTAQHVRQHMAHRLSNGAHDARQLEMAIWY